MTCPLKPSPAISPSPRTRRRHHKPPLRGGAHALLHMCRAAFATRDSERMPYALHRAIEALLASLECASGGCKAAATREAALALRRRQQATRRGGDDGLARREKPDIGCRLPVWISINFSG